MWRSSANPLPSWWTGASDLRLPSDRFLRAWSRSYLRRRVQPHPSDHHHALEGGPWNDCRTEESLPHVCHGKWQSASQGPGALNVYRSTPRWRLRQASDSFNLFQQASVAGVQFQGETKRAAHCRDWKLQRLWAYVTLTLMEQVPSGETRYKPIRDEQQRVTGDIFLCGRCGKLTTGDKRGNCTCNHTNWRQAWEKVSTWLCAGKPYHVTSINVPNAEEIKKHGHWFWGVIVWKENISGCLKLRFNEKVKVQRVLSFLCCLGMNVLQNLKYFQCRGTTPR